MSNDSIIVRGARVHNLKNIDVEVQHNQLTVVTGVSGSGKSSLAFDTIYAEGQRRYVESLSAYARQFLERIEKPDVDLIDGIAPAVAIRQKNTTRNPRSTVATATEILDYLRLLFARVGRTFCIQCGREVRRDTVDEVAAILLAMEEGTRLNVLFPLDDHSVIPPEAPKKKVRKKSAKSRTTVQNISDHLKARLFELRKRGFNRLYQNGKIYEFSTPESLLDVNFSEPIYLLVDRLVISADARARIVDAIETGYRESGEVIFETAPRDGGGPEQLRFSQRFECKRCNIRYEDPEPRLFSFNNPYGACPRCQGFGNTIDFDMDLVIPDPSKSLGEGAVEPWTKPKYRPLFTELKRFARQEGIPTDVAWAELAAEQQCQVIEGEGKFLGIRGFFNHLERKKYKLHVRVFLSRYRGYSTCSNCGGARLRPEARQVKIDGKDICQITSMTVEEASTFFENVRLTEQQAAIAEKLLQELQERLRFLNEVGLEYLTLDRLSSTLSGGEAQRIQLATSLGSRLVGALYVLDEPSIGLHTRDTARLIHILEELRDLGNTILVVEHDADVLRSADHLLDLGPGAGEFGGKLLAEGVLAEIEANPNSLTGRYLSGQISIPVPTRRRSPGREKLVLRGAEANNLKGIDVEIPLGLLVAITGVSGSGKSTLVHQVLYRAVARALGQTDGADASGLFKSLTGVERLNDVVLVDQTPIGRTPRSNPITYIKGFDLIRDLFSSQPEAKRLSLTPGHFSFNVPGGRCKTCEGDGTVTVEMQFLADVELPCEDCNGTRYQARILEVQYKGKNIHEVLQMTVKEALRFFAGQTRLLEKLAVLDEVGLGYLRLGQSATTLSGGEAQRVKLAAHLAQVRSANATARPSQASRVLYILDEPTTGLHFDDVSKLLTAFRKLIDGGGSLIVIEHNLDVIKSADWVIDLGPEGGEAGGRIVAEGTPEEIASNHRSYTGKWLAKTLQFAAS